MKLKSYCLPLLLCLILLQVGCAVFSSNPPTAYDMRDYNLVTPVKDQNGEYPDGSSELGSTVGLCWAFSSLNCLESSRLKQGLINSPTENEANLSPWYLGNYIGFNEPYYNYNSKTLPGILPPLTFGYYSLDGNGWGGSGPTWTADFLIAGKRLPTWDECPMPIADQSAHRNLTKPTLNTTASQHTIKEMIIFFPTDFANDLVFRNHLKRFILKNGAVASFIHLEPVDCNGITYEVHNGVEYFGHRFMDKKNFALYTYETDNFSTSRNTHAVSIIGWDDNRQINVDGRKTIGAWLVKDSVGVKSHDRGFFWVAYDDQIHIKDLAGALIADRPKYKHPSTYQTHAGGLTKTDPKKVFPDDQMIELGIYNYLFNGSTTEAAWGVAKFALAQAEKLAAVAIFTSNREEQVTVNVYKNSEKDRPLYSKQFKIADIGYHLLDLGKEIPFKAGETAIIAIGFKPNGSKRRPLLYVQDNTVQPPYPTYFGTMEKGNYNLTPYASLGQNATFFVQAVMAKEN